MRRATERAAMRRGLGMADHAMDAAAEFEADLGELGGFA